MAFVRDGATSVVLDDDGASRWWTFAGRRANTWLAAMVAGVRTEVSAIDDLWIALDPGTDGRAVRDLLGRNALTGVTLGSWVSDEAVKNLKFSDCLPAELALRVVEARPRDDESVRTTTQEPQIPVHRVR